MGRTANKASRHEAEQQRRRNVLVELCNQTRAIALHAGRALRPLRGQDGGRWDRLREGYLKDAIAAREELRAYDYAIVQKDAALCARKLRKSFARACIDRALAEIEDTGLYGLAEDALAHGYRRLGAKAMLHVDVNVVLERIGEAIQKTKQEELLDALLELRPGDNMVNEPIDELTWATQVTALHDNPPPLHWWMSLLEVVNWEFSDQTYDELDEAHRLLLDEAVRKRVDELSKEA